MFQTPCALGQGNSLKYVVTLADTTGKQKGQINLSGLNKMSGIRLFSYPKGNHARTKLCLQQLDHLCVS